MKTLGTFAASALLTVAVIAPAYGQQPGASPGPHHPGGPGSTTPAPGPKGASMPMMDMCRQMMGDMAMSGMGGGATADPKEKADMLQMRAEMMKAMGDIMMKHAQRMKEMPGR